jgi:tRNA (guanine-N7-)-methyltransferase
MARRLPELLIDVDASPPADCRSLFPIAVDETRLEIGCGAGEHLVHQAAHLPSVGFIGVEPFREGLGKTVAAIDEAGCRNVRLFDDDAALLLDWLPAGSLGVIDVPYPDPWPKRRHWKRRLISDANLERIARVLRRGGLLRVATDIAGYAEWTLLAVRRQGGFAWTAEKADDWRLPWPDWPGTRYEAKAFAAGRRPTYLVFRRR